MKSVTIVGLGWLGLPLGMALHEQGWQVKGSKRVIETPLPFETASLQLPISHPEQEKTLAALLKAQALVITLPPNKSANLAAYTQNVKTLAEQAMQAGVSHLIFTSSSSVFPNISGWLEESSLVEPDSELGKGLLALEQWLLSLPINVDIVRLAGLVGGQRHPVKYLAGKTAQQDNSPVNLLHLDDAVRAISLLLENPQGKRLFHLVSPEHPTRKDFYLNVAKALGLNKPEFICTEQDPKRYFIGNKICEALGFEYQFHSPYQMTEFANFC